MVRNLAAGMAMITCREQIINSFTQNLKTTFLTIITVRRATIAANRSPVGSFLIFVFGARLQNPTHQQKEMVEHAVTACVNDNMDLACAFVQKTTVDKAVVEIDRHMMSVSEECGDGFSFQSRSNDDVT